MDKKPINAEEQIDTRKESDTDSWPIDEEPVIEISLEALEAEMAEARDRREVGQWIDTAHSDGSTDNPMVAQRQGLVYTPPSDPPVLPSADGQNVTVAAGFASSLEETDPSVVRLPEHVEGGDLTLEQNIGAMLRNSSETANLENISVAVQNGVVLLTGETQTAEEITIVDEMIRDTATVVDVHNRLTVAGE